MIGNSRSAGKRSLLGEFVLSEISEGGEKHHYSFSPPKEEGKKILHFDFHSFLLSLFPKRKYWREEERERKRYWKKRKGWGVTEETIFLLPPSHFPRFSFFPFFLSPVMGERDFPFSGGHFSLPTGSPPRLGGISRGRREAGKNTDFDLSLLLLLRPRFLIVFLSSQATRLPSKEKRQKRAVTFVSHFFASPSFPCKWSKLRHFAREKKNGKAKAFFSNGPVTKFK